MKFGLKCVTNVTQSVVTLWAYTLAPIAGSGTAIVTGEVTPISLSRLPSVSRKESLGGGGEDTESFGTPGRGVCGRLICATNPSNSLIYNMAFKVSLLFPDQL